MKEEIYMMFSEFLDSIWTGAIWGVRISVAICVVYWSIKGLTGWASMLKAAVQ